MDIYSLAAANLHSASRPAPGDSKAEDRYYSDRLALPRLAPRLLGAIVVCALLIHAGMPPG